MHRIREISLAIVACLTMMSCTLPPVRLGVPGPGGATLARKEVVAKEEPATLIARDGTICLVAGDRFEKTAVGDLVTCGWRRPGDS